jgi:hypothetical protein
MRAIRSHTLIAGLLATAAVAFSWMPTSADAAICPKIFKPVCGLAPNGTRVTYPNACVARGAHATVLHPGKCIGGQFCPFIWQPVCAIDPFWKQKRTYPNMCVAEHDNAVWVHNGPCP